MRNLFLIRHICRCLLESIRSKNIMESCIKNVNKPLSTDSSDIISIEEGKAKMIFPRTCNVFYNPVQEFNRDLSVAVIKEYVKEQQEMKAFVRAESVNNKTMEIDDELSDNHNPEKSEIDEKAIPMQSKLNRNTKFNSQDSVEITFDAEPFPMHPKAIQLITHDSLYQGITILEALSASGLRAIRYAKEIPYIKNIIANDLSDQAVKTIEHNTKHNEVDHLITTSHNDAVLLMHQHKHYSKRFDVVDIDPYGSPTPFLDAAVQCVKDGGILCVTCTDVAILCGNASETCHAKYGSMSIKTNCYHEMALRIVLRCIESHANRYGRYIVPLISLSADFYVRFFVRLYTSSAVVKRTASKLAMVYECVGCETVTLQPLGKMKPHENGRDFRFSCADGPTVGTTCSHCNSSRHRFGGPIWANSMHDVAFVQKLLNSVENEPENYSTAKRMIGTLHLLKEELPDVPLFFSMDRIHSLVHVTQCKLTLFRSALLNAGYRVSDSHTCRNSVKTDAPAQVVWDIVRAWSKQVNTGKKFRDDKEPGKVILDQEIQTTVSFDYHPEANPESKEKGLLRYQQNPAPFWGPKSKSTVNLMNITEQSKSKRLQGKRLKKFAFEGNKNYHQYHCKRFKEGNCDLGNDCRYLHVNDDEEPSKS